ncbi:MAG: hypothetical protein H6810_03715 [Phycisphaeraceae bacterium]|nr:MAG: hypothetical protein H6810_03715 [Phycisphaeraceae bacterium]
MKRNIIITGAAVLALVAGTADGQYYQYELASVDDEGSLSIAQTNDGGFVTAGWRKVVDAGGIYNKDFYIVKHDKDGHFQWLRVWGGPEDDVAYSIRQTMDGGYIIAGETESFEQNMELVLLRLDPSGQFLWAKAYPHQVAGDTIHHPHAGVALDLLVPNEEIIVTAYFMGHPTLTFTDPNGNPIWQMSYFLPPVPPMIDGALHAFTDVDIDQNERTAVVSGSLEYRDPAGTNTKYDDAILMKLDVNVGFPLWYFKYDWPFDRDDPDDPNVKEYGHGVDIAPDGFIYSAGKTDFGREFIDSGVITIVTDPGGVPFNMMRYQPLETDGRILYGAPGYASVEFDQRFFTVAIAGTVQRIDNFVPNAFLMLTDPMLIPFWTWAYGDQGGVDPVWPTWGESVAVADLTCGWGVAGRGELTAPPSFLGAGDNYLVKTEDNGVSGCNERHIDMAPEMPGMEMPLPVEPFQIFGVVDLPDLLRVVQGQELQFCYYPTCYTGPCNRADLAPYWGILDLQDINAFITAFVNGQAIADLNGDGILDLRDIQIFITDFVAGCP